MKMTGKLYRTITGKLNEPMSMAENDTKTDKQRNEKDVTWKRHGHAMKMT